MSKKTPNKVKICRKDNQGRKFYHGDFVFEKSPSFTNKLSRAERNLSVTYDDIKSPDDIRAIDGSLQKNNCAWGAPGFNSNI
jgi:hypothetical protein